MTENTMPMAEETPGRDRKLLVVAGGSAGLLVVGAAGFLLLHGGGSSDDAAFTVPKRAPRTTQVVTSASNVKAKPPVTKTVPAASTVRIGRDPFTALYVVPASVPGYGAAVHAGLLAATREYVAFMDGDDSFDPAELLPLLEDVRSGRADLAVGRRRPVGRGVWPWHARAGNALIVWWLRRRIGLAVHDIAPIRVCRRDTLLALDVRDRRFGYPVELLQNATRAGWRVTERDVSYRPRAAGTRSKVSGSVVGTARTARDFWRVLA